MVVVVAHVAAMEEMKNSLHSVVYDWIPRYVGAWSARRKCRQPGRGSANVTRHSIILQALFTPAASPWCTTTSASQGSPYGRLMDAAQVATAAASWRARPRCRCPRQ